MPDRPSNEEILNYSELKSSIMPYSKKLKTIIQKTLEHKKTLPRSDLPFGRLNKKLIRLITDENPRLFYKKGNPSPEINAAFTLLVDCSASMSDKMDQTKLGIILFHEALKALLIEHEIIGFYEDANHATDKRQPNYFKKVIDFTSSRRAGSGPEILQLEAEEDNRDGFAIRLASARLWQRLEKQKFLLVFSDGEPAAYDYEQNGIIDTHEAVLEARKKGIEVINVFLANRQLEEHEQKNIENIYGRFSVIVENIDELPNMLFPLLRKLLLKSLES
jgi:nitric oxide reductase activation protein